MMLKQPFPCIPHQFISACQRYLAAAGGRLCMRVCMCVYKQRRLCAYNISAHTCMHVFQCTPVPPFHLQLKSFHWLCLTFLHCRYTHRHTHMPLLLSLILPGPWNKTGIRPQVLPLDFELTRHLRLKPWWKNLQRPLSLSSKQTQGCLDSPCGRGI